MKIIDPPSFLKQPLFYQPSLFMGKIWMGKSSPIFRKVSKTISPFYKRGRGFNYALTKSMVIVVLYQISRWNRDWVLKFGLKGSGAWTGKYGDSFPQYNALFLRFSKHERFNVTIVFQKFQNFYSGISAAKHTWWIGNSDFRMLLYI